jgi:hypothetical protein
MELWPSKKGTGARTLSRLGRQIAGLAAREGALTPVFGWLIRSICNRGQN